MATITTRKDQHDTASAARKVGGYSELVRLAAERHGKGSTATLSRNAATGKWSVKSTTKF